MITCVFFKKKLVTLRGYVTLLHCKVHRNEPRCLFKSVGANCSQTFTTYSAFKGHFYRVHNAPQAAPIAVVADLKCAVSLCARRFHKASEDARTAEWLFRWCDRDDPASAQLLWWEGVHVLPCRRYMSGRRGPTGASASDTRCYCLW